MLITLKLKLVAAAFSAASALAGSALVAEPDYPSMPPAGGPELVSLPAGSFRHRLPGEFTLAGKPVNAPLATVRIDRPLAIMKRQVTAAEYGGCVRDGACQGTARDAPGDAATPMVRVNWRDAQAYARWLSGRTGRRYRLPTDAEWAFAAGSRFHDDALPDGVGVDLAARWLARYELEAGREAAREKAPQPVGSFGANENGLLDVAGNVWEWADTCFERTDLDRKEAAATRNCGVRVVEGRHRSYMIDFVRDPRTGGCASGTPPDNLGFRLVRDEPAVPLVARLMDRIHRPFFRKAEGRL